MPKSTTRSKVSDAPFRISNSEALEMFQNHHKADTKSNKRFQHRNWIEQRVMEHLEASPCTKLDTSRRQELSSLLKAGEKLIQPADESQRLVDDDLTGYGLSDYEVMQILDFMPSEQVEMYLMVSGYNDYSDRKKEALIDLVASFKVPPTGRSEARNKEADEMETVPIPFPVVKTELL
jgi:hypothetical protein